MVGGAGSKAWWVELGARHEWVELGARHGGWSWEQGMGKKKKLLSIAMREYQNHLATLDVNCER